MDTYNESLKTTTSNILAALSAQQTQLQSAQITAEYSLYYAQGAELTARTALEGTELAVIEYDHISSQIQFNSNQVFNLVASLTQANVDTTASVTNVATAAANVQIAANAISTLGADIGAALSIATTYINKTDSYNKIVEAAAFVNEVANSAQEIAFKLMEVSSHTSEIASSALLNQGTVTQTKIGAVATAVNTEFNKYLALATTENQTLAQACKQDRQKEGALLDANREVKAITNVYKNANCHLNLNLTVAVISSKSIRAAFTALPNPLPTFYAPPASDIKIPDAKPNYYLFLVPEQAQTLLSVDLVEQMFAHRDDPELKGTFYSVTASKDPDGKCVSDHSNVIDLSLDVYGTKVEAGKNYVAFIYSELSPEYKRYVNNYSDLVSAPSQFFTPATLLPSAKHFSEKGGTSLTLPDILFEIDLKSASAADIAAIMAAEKAKTLEYRCILVETDNLVTTLKADLNLLSCPESDYYKTAGGSAVGPLAVKISLPIYFNLAIAEQVAPINYTLAVLVSGTGSIKQQAAESDESDTCVDPAKPPSTQSWEVKFTTGTTDNFGNLIRPGVHYKPYILAIVKGADTLKFTPVLSLDSTPIHTTETKAAN
jgi:hypothetical protein